MKNIKYDCHITITSRHTYTSAYNVKRAQAELKSFLGALRYKFDGKHFWCMGVGHDGNRIHYHILYQGGKPSKKWIKRKMFARNGCYQVKVEKFHPDQIQYLIRQNAARVPHPSDVPNFSADGAYGLHIHRIGASRGFLPPPPRAESPLKGTFLRVEVIDA